MRVAVRNKGLIILHMSRVFSDLISVWGKWAWVPLENQGHLSVNSAWLEIVEVSALGEWCELEMALWAIEIYMVVGTVHTDEVMECE